MERKGSVSFATFCEDMVEKAARIDEYRVIMDRLHKVDLSKDEAFQRTFTHFYRVRKPKAWLDRFYAAMERMKSVPGLSFCDILPVVSRLGSRPSVEISFASKVAHTFDPTLPIWDENVANRLGLKKPLPVGRASFEERMASAVECYEELKTVFDYLMHRDECALEAVRAWDSSMPKFKCLPDAKKLDFMLWALPVKGA